jgi:hypothetical protein
MANDVFANGREISCKSGQGISTCEFPDVCFTPPQTAATPPGVPVPYPNTGLARDTSGGSRSVKISGKEVMLRDRSFFKRSAGDEAGCAPKKGIVTSTHRGKVYFIGWSMDVLIEGKNVVRHLDLTTHNHASQTGTGSVPTVHRDTPAGASQPPPCRNAEQDFNAPCHGRHRTPPRQRGEPEPAPQPPHSFNPGGCNTVICSRCTDKSRPECVLEADEARREYRRTQEGTREEIVGRESNKQRQKAFGLDAGESKGAYFMMSVLGLFAHRPDFVTTSYFAHCLNCHSNIEIDLVTRDYVLECKVTADAFKQKQTRRNTQQIAQECFPGKKVGMVTDADPANIREATSTLQKWKQQGVNVDLFKFDQRSFTMTQVPL